MNKKIVKLSIIRKDEADPCPFGLDIVDSCSSAGDLVQKMAPLDMLGPKATDEEKAAMSEANRRLLNWGNPGQRCIFASKIMDEEQAVECNFGDVTQGTSETVPFAAPFYAKTYNNTTYDGLFAAPMSWYGDYDITTNLYYGINSLVGSNNNEEIKKFADYLDKLNKDFDSLDDNYKDLLKNFANTHANNYAFLKRSILSSETNRVLIILNQLKDVK